MRLAVFSVLLLSATGVLSASAPDALALSCPVCHGGPAAQVPDYAAQPAEQIEASLRAFRDGTQPGTAMPRLLAPLDDAELHRLAQRAALATP
jgi:cytochrome c553